MNQVIIFVKVKCSLTGTLSLIIKNISTHEKLKAKKQTNKKILHRCCSVQKQHPAPCHLISSVINDDAQGLIPQMGVTAQDRPVKGSLCRRRQTQAHKHLYEEPWGKHHPERSIILVKWCLIGWQTQALCCCHASY